MKSLFKVFAVVLCASMMATSMTGCHKKKKPLDTPKDIPAANNQGGGDQLATPTGEFLPWGDVNGGGTIYFDYDKSDIRASETAKLEANAAKIKALPANVQVRVEGNCDERGTQEYNVALGERRALAVRDYLIKLGCDGSRLVTISYGEEKPVDAGHGEGAWSKNRRAEFSKNG